MSDDALVGIVMGSDSDLSTMQAAADALDELAIPHEVRVVSAHRAPREMLDYGSRAHGRGLRGDHRGRRRSRPSARDARRRDAAAGDRGFPSRCATSTASTRCCRSCRCRPGVPVATVGIGNARNAGLLAARILAAGDPQRTEAILAFQRELRSVSQAKDARVRDAHASAAPESGETA